MTLPIADAAQVRRAGLRLIRLDRPAFALMILLNALAAVAGLVAPRLVGEIIDAIRAGRGIGIVDRYSAEIVAAALVQLVLVRYARNIGYRFGERMSARIREQFLDRALALPASIAERAATGDLTARGTSDVQAVAYTLRDVGPDVVIAVISAVFMLAAVFFISPLLGLCGIPTLICLSLVSRWYLRRSRVAYLAEGASSSVLAEVLAATAGGARTVEALGLQQRRISVTEDAIEVSRAARMRTLFLRSVLFPGVDISYIVPVVTALLVGGALLDHHVVSLGAVSAATLYLYQLSGPMDRIMQWLEQLQSSGASFARIEGLAAAPRTAAQIDVIPADDRIEVTDVRFAYHDDLDVLLGVDLSVRTGERLAVVGPSGAGKSTLGRLLAGVDSPRTGTATVGGVPIADLTPDRLRRQVVLVTQEHHVFGASVRDNLLIARPDATDAQLHAALTAVDVDWLDGLPEGIDTEVGSAGHQLDGAQAQQIALARVVLADPHTLILDEATALLDPATARNTERALAAVLDGRTVIAIAHRLQTAHDADRVAVMDGGRVTELGTHDDLVAAEGAYAALWHSWHGDNERHGDSERHGDGLTPPSPPGP